MRKAIALILALVMMLGMVGCGGSNDYKNAVSLYEEGKYEAAQELFEQLGDYKDSAEMASKCRVLRCENLIYKTMYGQLPLELAVDFSNEDNWVYYSQGHTRFELDNEIAAREFYDSLESEEQALVSNKYALPPAELIELTERQLLLDEFTDTVLEQAVKEVKKTLINSSSYEENPNKKSYALAYWDENDPTQFHGSFAVNYSATNSFGGRIDDSKHGYFAGTYLDGVFTLTDFYFSSY